MKTTGFVYHLSCWTVSLFLITLPASAQEGLFDWVFETGDQIQATARINESTLYIGSFDHRLYALDLDGNEKWTFDTSYPIKSQPLVRDTIVCVLSGNRLYGVHTDDGRLLWKHEPEEATLAEPVIEYDFFDMKDSSPVLKDSIAYYGNEYGSMFGVNIYTGEQAFSYNTGREYRIRIKALIQGDTLFFGDRGGYIYALSMPDTTLLWSVRTHNDDGPAGAVNFGAVIGEMVSDGEHLFFGLKNGRFQVLDKDTGNEVWSYGDTGGSWISGVPVVSEGIVYVGESFGNRLLALDIATGELVWAFNAGLEIYNAPLILNDYILLMSGDANFPSEVTGTGRIHLLDKQGELLNAILMPSSIFNTPQYEDGVIYFGSRDSKVYGLDLASITTEAVVSLELEDPSVLELEPISPGMPTLIEIGEIENTGTALDTIDYTYVSGNIPDGAIRLSPGSAGLYVNGSSSLRFRIYPDSLQDGSYDFTFTGTSRRNPSIAVERKVSFEVSFHSLTSISGQQATKYKMKVYPNPGSGELNFEVILEKPAHLRLEVSDLEGKVIHINEHKGTHGKQTIYLDLSDTQVRGMLIYRLFQGRELLATGKILRE